jgi:hypothetical protein
MQKGTKCIGKWDEFLNMHRFSSRKNAESRGKTRRDRQNPKNWNFQHSGAGQISPGKYMLFFSTHIIHKMPRKCLRVSHTQLDKYHIPYMLRQAQHELPLFFNLDYP